MISRLSTVNEGFHEALASLLAFPEDDRLEVRGAVEQIIRDVRSRGDEVLLALTNRFDGQSAETMAELTLDPAQLEQAYESLNPLVRDALLESADRVRDYHERQLKAMGDGASWQYTDTLGNELGQRIRAMQKVGIYAPGGKAAYPSTIIMTAIPARVAGVEEILLCVPTPAGARNDVLLATAHICGIDRVFTIGGAQAVAAMAYGTKSVPRVDKIVGPGNIYVATAKEMVFGDVGIDMIAGPSEVVIVADETADPAWVIQDMFAQAEHDELAQAIVISSSSELLDAIAAALPARMAMQQRETIIRSAINDRGGLILVRDMEEAFDVVNRIAPEHLQLALQEPQDHLDKVRHAGAVFLGMETTEVVGDYTAGPSHVLPTSGTARFASPLGVYDFLARTSVVRCSAEGAIQLNRAAAIIAAEEGLDAHAESALARVKG